MESILKSIRELVVDDKTCTHFDKEIIIHINSALVSLTQLGVGPSEGFSIKDESAVWTDFIPNINRVETVKSFVHLKVKLLFDPPTNSAILESIKESIRELEFRINVFAESTF